MDIQYYGGNCVRLSTKKATVVVDDNLQELGHKPISKAGEISLYTGAHGEPNPEAKIVIDRPGEYEVSGISIQGIAARAHIDEEDKHTATMFKIVAGEMRIAVVGHVYPELSDAQLEAIGMVDVLIIPVGGNGYTLDSIGALKLIKKIEPKVVVPTHYDEAGLSFPVPQQPLDQALKGLAMEPQETTSKLKLKAGELADTTQLIVLELS